MLTLVALYSVGSNPRRSNTRLVFKTVSGSYYKIEKTGDGDWLWIERRDFMVSLQTPDLDLAKERLKELIKQQE